MRGLFTIILLSVTLVTNAQTKLSGEETIKYIKDKIGETHGHQIIWKTGPVRFVISTTFFESGKGIYFKYENGLNNYKKLTAGNLWYSNTFEFNPEQIVNVVDGSSNTTSASPVGFITIDFSSNLVKKDIINWTHTYPNTNYVADYAWENTIAEKEM